MKQAKIIDLLQEKQTRIEDPGFNFETWKGGIARVLDRALGKGNSLSRQVQGLEYDYKMSYEELYPKKVIDWEASKKKFNAVLQEVIDQVKMMEEESFAGNDDTPDEAVVINAIRKALKNNLSGLQISRIKQSALHPDQAERKVRILESLEQYDLEIVRNMMVDILATPEFWEHFEE